MTYQLRMVYRRLEEGRRPRLDRPGMDGITQSYTVQEVAASYMRPFPKGLFNL